MRKKKRRAEKRRLAEKKRKEAKKQKQLELEQQRLRDEKERVLNQEQRRLQEDFSSQDLNQQRRSQIVASYVDHVSRDRNHQTPTHATHPPKNSVNPECIPLNAPSQTFSQREQERVDNEKGPRFQEKLDRIVGPYVDHVSRDRNHHTPTHAMHQLKNSINPEYIPPNAPSQTFSRVPTSYPEGVRQNALTKRLDNGHSNTAESFNRPFQSQANSNPIEQPSKPSIAEIGVMYQVDQPENYVVRNATSVAALSTSNHHATYSIQSQSPLAQAALPAAAASSASLDGIAALLGLANLANNTKTLPESPLPATSPNPEWANYAASFGTIEPQANSPFSTSHGFGANSAAIDANGEAKSGIPSYASIRENCGNGSSNEVAVPIPNTVAATASLPNGYTHEAASGEPQSLSWYSSDRNQRS